MQPWRLLTFGTDPRFFGNGGGGGGHRPQEGAPLLGVTLVLFGLETTLHRYLSYICRSRRFLTS